LKAATPYRCSKAGPMISGNETTDIVPAPPCAFVPV
jgi:hypothetical protein